MTNAGFPLLPSELVLQIVSDADDSLLLTLLLCSRGLSYLLTPILHARALAPRDNLSAIQWAASQSHVRLIKYLLVHGMHPDTGASHTHPPALHAAVCLHRTDVVELLVSHGADVDRENPNNCSGLESVIHTAASNGDTPIVMLLAIHGADIHSANTMGTYRGTPLHAAVSSLSAPAVKTLLELHVKVDEQNSELETPLDIAATVATNILDSEFWFAEALVIGKMLVQAGAEVRYTEESVEMLRGLREEERALVFQSLMMETKKAMGGV